MVDFRDVHVERLEFDVALESGPDEVRSFEYADSFTPAQGALLDETSKSTHSLV
jgi:hypothetical protein